MIDVGFDHTNPKKNNVNNENSSPKISSKELSYTFRDFNNLYKIKAKKFFSARITC